MLLIISEYFGEKDGPAGIVVEKAIKAFENAGVNFCLISSGRQKKNENYLKVKRYLLDYPRLRYYEDSYYIKKTGHPKVGSWGYRALHAAKKKFADKKWTAIIAWSNPISSLYVGLYLKGNKEIPLLWRCDDPYPPYNYPSAPGWKPPSKHKEFENEWLKSNLDKITAISAPNEMLAQWMVEKLSFKKRCVVWPHYGGTITNELDYQKSVKVKLDQQCLNIAYLGRLSDNRNPEPLLEAIKTHNGDSLSIILHVFGSIHKNWVKAINAGVKSGYVKKYGEVNYKESLVIMKEFDALLLIEANFECGIFLPSKFCDYISVKKPMLIATSKNSVVEKIVGHTYPGLIGYDHDIMCQFQVILY